MLCSMEHVPCFAACSMLCSISNALQHVYCFAACIMLCSMFTVPCGILTLQHIRIKNSFDPLVTGLSFKRCVCALCVSSALTHTHTLCSNALQQAHVCFAALCTPALQQVTLDASFAGGQSFAATCQSLLCRSSVLCSTPLDITHLLSLVPWLARSY